MYVRLGLETEQQLRAHVARTVWGARTECFIASFDRDIFYDPQTNTRVILFYRGAGTCLVTRAGAREFLQPYNGEKDRHLLAGNDEGSMPPIVWGGIRALHPEIGQPPDEARRLPSDSEQTTS